MNLFGLTITRTKAAPNAALITHLPAPTAGGWYPILGRIREAFATAWQRNITYSVGDVMAYYAVWACVTLIASDIGKMLVRLVQHEGDDIWLPVENSAYSPVLRKPNHFQNRIQFFQTWVLSKLLYGNAYILKERDNSNKVRALYVLDPCRVHPQVASDGSVFYSIGQDYLSGVGTASVQVPARDIIHDIYVAVYHPLVGLSPIHACGLAAMQGLRIQQGSANFFEMSSMPGGLLTTEGKLDDADARRFEEVWNANFAGPENAGKVAALGNGLKYQPLTMSARDAQLVDQLKLTGEQVCSTFHVPAYMVGITSPPNYDNIEGLNQQYYSQCLQALIEAIELCLDEALDLPADLGIEFDVESLLRMDSATKMETATGGVKGGVFTPNEARLMFNKKPLKGGDTVYLQQQDYSIDALNRRDQAQAAPDSTKPVTPDPEPIPVAAEPEDEKSYEDAVIAAFVVEAVKERWLHAA